MTDTEELLKVINESGLKKGSIAQQLGLSTYGFQKKVENKTQFKAGEIQKLCIILGISTLEQKEKIFFAHNVDNMTT